MIDEQIVNLIRILLTIIITGAISYTLGRSKTLFDSKQIVYSEAIEPIITRAFDPTKVTDQEINRAVAQLWLYGSKKVARAMDNVVRIIIDPTRGDIVKSLQKLLAEMRNDIQILTRQRLKADEFLHIYQQIKVKDNSANSEP